MAQWQYEGTTTEGEFRRGEIDGDTKDAAQQKLKQMGVSILKLKKKQKEIEIVIPGITDTVPVKNMVIFTRQMATMIDAGLPLVQALDLVGNSEPNPNLKKTILGVKSSVESGSSFSDSLKKYPKVFEELYINLVSAGEMGGILDTIMNRLAEYIEKAAETKAKVKGAMKYPVTVLVVAMSITAGLLWKVVPTFAATFRSMGRAELPAITEFVVGISNGFTAKLPFIVGGIVGSVVLYKIAMKTKQGPYIRDWMLYHGPVIGNVVRKSSVAKFTRTLGTLVSAGVPIIEALQIVGKTSGNLVVERAVDYTRAKILEGRNMTAPLMETQVFPVMVVQMIAVGEATGAMDVMLGKIADFYDSEVDEAIEGMTAMMEPIIMVVLGGIIGTVMMAMYMPIFTMGEGVK
ncbi:MAG: type II secretion system F family protein [Deltaproteobacteria bacterium]|nr:type II secretion system F family protein [Deltaproteobacteria bacterium]